MDRIVSRKMYQTLEPYHAMLYFALERKPVFERVGLQGSRMGYFATRAASLGAASADVVIAIFYNFHPALVRSVIPEAWQRATPAQIVAARFEAADLTLRRILGEQVTSAAMQEAATLAREATTGCPPEGRPLFAAHAALSWPTAAHLVLWHAVTLLREFRFAGHCAALLAAEVGACEALITHAATGEISARVLKSSRAWPDDEWEAAAQRLRERGWLTAEGMLTEEGKQQREQIEQQTDQMALPPWRHLGEAACTRLRELVRPYSRAIVQAGTFPVDLSPWDND